MRFHGGLGQDHHLFLPLSSLKPYLSTAAVGPFYFVFRSEPSLITAFLCFIAQLYSSSSPLLLYCIPFAAAFLGLSLPPHPQNELFNFTSGGNNMNRKHKALLLDLLPNSNSTSMASRFLARECAFALLLFSLCGSRSSAIIWAFCAEANENEADSLLQTNMQFNVHLWKPLALLDCVSSEVASVSLFVDAHQTKKLLESKFQITSRAQNGAPHMNISSIVVNSSQECPSLLLSTMSSILLALETAGAHRNIKVSALFSLATLERLAKKNSEKGLQRIFDFVIQSDSFITVEVLADKGDDLVQHAIEKAVVACSLLPADVCVVLYLKSFQPDHNGVSMLKLMETMSISMESNPLAKGRILMFFVQVPAFQTFHRVLISEVNKKISSTKVFIHDNYPITIPSTIPNPTPTIITVPSTNPVSVLPTSPSTIPTTAPITVPSTNPMPIPFTNPANPTNAPITIPSTNPMSNPVTNPSNPTYTPITVPSTDPSTNPSTNPTLAPSIPVTNPVTTPVTEPTNQPVTNPVTTSPFSQPSVTPTSYES
ncbi:hypothetical protein HPP92_010873 [Vanilla planifolia]|uniref:Uncharacterized protein n=1 Tax=Vanilla planifolia TaxID=51239 RepID=A0A835R1Q6_VANPL|nr:hypothetical protein HPP92_010873 [Vanilla planifolia]